MCIRDRRWAYRADISATRPGAAARSPSPTLSRMRTGFWVRKRKPRRCFSSSGSSASSRIGWPSTSRARSRSRRGSSRSFASRSAGVPCRPEPRSRSSRRSTTARSARTNSRSSCSRSRHGSTDPDGCGSAGSSHARITCSSASASRRRARCSAGSSSVPTWPSVDAGGAGRSTYVTSAWTTFFGWKMPASRSSRGSGTLTTPTWSSIPPKPPVWTFPRVSVLKTVVLPDPASPTIAICIPSVSGPGVHPVEQRLARGEPAEVLREQLDAPVEDPAARPGGVRCQDDVGEVVERRGGRERLVAERVEHGATKPSLPERAEQGALHDQPAARDVDQPRGPLHQGERAVIHEVLRLDREGQGQDDEVGDREEVAERLGAAQVHAGGELRLAGPGRRVAAHGDHARPERRGQLRHRAPDAPEADDPEGDVPELAPLERLPRPLGLELQELRKAPADGQHHEQDVLRDGPAEDASGVRDGQSPRAGGRGEEALDARRGRMHPAQGRRMGKEALERVGGEEAVQQDLDIVDGAVGDVEVLL